MPEQPDTLPKKLPRHKARFDQMILGAAGGKDEAGDPWDDPEVRGSWHGSVIVGDFFEELTGQLFPRGTCRFVQDSNADVCPDHVEANGEFFIECKATGPRGRHWFLHKHAMDHYTELLDTYWPARSGMDFEPVMLFVFWTHAVKEKVRDFQYQSDLQFALAQNVSECYVLDFEMVKNVLSKCRLEDGERWRGAFWRIRPHQLRGLRDDWEVWVKNMCGVLNGYAPRVGVVRDLSAYTYKVVPFTVHALLSKDLYGKTSLRRFWRSLRVGKQA